MTNFSKTMTVKTESAKEEITDFSWMPKNIGDKMGEIPDSRDGYKATVQNGRWTGWTGWGVTVEEAQKNLFGKIVNGQ